MPDRRRDEFGAVFEAFNGAADALEPRLASAAAPAPTAVLATRISSAALAA